MNDKTNSSSFEVETLLREVVILQKDFYDLQAYLVAFTLISLFIFVVVIGTIYIIYVSVVKPVQFELRTIHCEIIAKFAHISARVPGQSYQLASPTNSCASNHSNN